MVRIIRIQHPVGHGGFHTGQATSAEGSSFNWVFDCGSRRETRIKSIVRDWCAANPDPIDWLFVSHFDTDHANGIDTLMDRVAVRNVMVPYVGVEDLIINLLHLINGDRQERWLFDMAANPVKFFQERGAENIVILGLPPKGPDRDGVEVLVPPPRPDSSWKTLIKIGPTSGQRRTAAAPYEAPYRDVVEIRQPGCEIQTGSDGVDLLLRPYCVQVASTTLDGMLAELARLTRQRVTTWSKQRSPMGLGKLADQIAEIARTATGRKELRRIYKTYAGSSNRSSLSLLSVPEIGGDCEWQVFISPREIDLPGTLWPDWGHPHAWMNTGDAELIKPADLERWSAHYGGHLREVGMLALPHHGSDRNSDAALQDQCPYALLTVQVRDSAPKRVSKHPGTNISTAAGKRLWRVTEKSGSGAVMRVSIKKKARTRRTSRNINLD